MRLNNRAKNLNREKSLQKTADQLLKLKGNIRGSVILANIDYIRNRRGEEGLRAVEEKMKELGYPLNFKELEPLKWYLQPLSCLLVIVAKDIFDWTEQDIFEMGNSAPKVSSLIKIIAKHFISPKKVFQKAPEDWKRHLMGAGEMEAIKIDEKQKYGILRIKNHVYHPVICVYEAGFFLRFAQYVIKGQNPRIKETKCIFRGDPYHEYLISWK